MDVVVRRHAYAPGGYTGWHSHPGPVLITVTKGELTFHEYDDGECKKVVLTAGQAYQPGYVDSGRGHFVLSATKRTSVADVTRGRGRRSAPDRGERRPSAGADDPLR
jgi:hypothetical protein